MYSVTSSLVLIMINDLVVENARLWKYVDNTTVSETVAKGELSNAQRTSYRSSSTMVT